MSGRRVPFNANQFMKQYFPTSYYRFGMEHGENAEFAEGWHGGADELNASPAALVNQGDRMSYGDFLVNWRNFIRGMADNMTYHLLTEDESTARKFGVDMSNPAILEALDSANEHMNPRLLFKAIGAHDADLHEAVDKHYGFNATRTVEKLDRLIDVLKHPNSERNKHSRGAVIRNAPQLLEDSKAIHKAIEQFQIEAEVESSANYPKIAEAINHQLDMVIENLNERIKKGSVGTKWEHSL